VLQDMFVQGVRNLQPADECECRDVLTAIGDLGLFALKVANVGFDVVALPHLNSENVVVVLFSLLARCVLGEERLGHLVEVAVRMWRQRVEPI